MVEVANGYRPRSVGRDASRHRIRSSRSTRFRCPISAAASDLGTKSDAADAHLLAEIVRLTGPTSGQLAGDSTLGEATKLTSRTHQSLICDRTRQVLRLRSALREFFPAALWPSPTLPPDAPSARSDTRSRHGVRVDQP